MNDWTQGYYGYYGIVQLAAAAIPHVSKILREKAT